MDEDAARWQVTLTFDNGPDEDGTPLVLETLRRHHLLATFFVIGSKLRQPSLLAIAKRARAEGHVIGNHTLTHGTPLGLRPETDAIQEVEEAQALLGPLGEPERLFRPNGGGALGAHLIGPALRRWLVEHGYSVVLWNAVPRDWEDPEGWPERALELCAAARPWAVLVLHDSAPVAMQRLDAVLCRLTASGARFVQGFPDVCVPVRPQGQALPRSYLHPISLDTRA